MEKDIKRYIGITGFKTKEEIDACKIISLNKEPIIMYGILTSQKTLNNPSSEGSRRPSLYQVPQLLEAIPKNAMPTIHHCTDNRDFYLELDKVLSYDNIYDKRLCTAIQLNQRLPKISELEKTIKKYPDLNIILQLEPMDLATPKNTGKKLNEYSGLIDYVIIDPSRGVGITLDINNSLEVLKEIKINAIPVIAGGLNSQNIKEVITFFRKEYGNNFCIDAEGKLRDENDKLNIKKMQSYITEAYKGYNN